MAWDLGALLALLLVVLLAYLAMRVVAEQAVARYHQTVIVPLTQPRPVK
jgi:hypothetical protein